MPLRGLEPRLDEQIEVIVKQRFDTVRPVTVERVETAWAAAAAVFCTRVQSRVDAIRSIAVTEFGAALRTVPVPAVAEEPDRFWYLFTRPELPDAPIWRALRLLLPHSVVRRRLITSAQHRLREALDKHAGRTRSDLARRLDATHRRFAPELTSFADTVIDDIHHATTQAADQQHDLADGELHLAERHTRIAAAITAARAACQPTDPTPAGNRP